MKDKNSKRYLILCDHCTLGKDTSFQGNVLFLGVLEQDQVAISTLDKIARSVFSFVKKLNSSTTLFL